MAFDYSTLFAGSELGDVWLADSGDHFQDSGRTTAAGADDPVGSATGQGGNHNASQATAGLRPKLCQDAGGKWYFEHAADYLVAGAVSDWIYLHNNAVNAYICAAVRIGAVADPDTIYGILGTGSGAASSQGGVLFWDDRSSVPRNEMLRYYVATGGSARYDAGSADNTLPPQQDAVIEIIRTLSSIQCFLDGELVFIGEQSSGSSGNSANPLAIGALGGGGSPLTGRIYGLLVTNTLPSPNDRIKITRDMANRLVVVPGNTASVTLPGFPASASGIAVDVSVDRDSVPFYSAIGQSANGSGELAIAATGCPLATGTRTVWIRCTNSDGNAGGVSNNSRAFYAPVEVTVS